MRQHFSVHKRELTRAAIAIAIAIAFVTALRAAPGQASHSKIVPLSGTWYARPADRRNSGDVFVYLKVSKQRIVSAQVAFESSLELTGCKVGPLTVTYFGDPQFKPSARIEQHTGGPGFHTLFDGVLFP